VIGIAHKGHAGMLPDGEVFPDDLERFQGWASSI
jgi:hypothetical protein